MNAWVITWEGTDRRITEDNKIVGVLSARNSGSDIEKLVDFIYHRTIFNVREMAYFANRRKARGARCKALFSTRERIFYGSNPCLYARKVKELEVKPDESGNVEVVSWVEYAIVENNESTGYTFKETVPEKTVSISRPANLPLAIDPMNGRVA